MKSYPQGGCSCLYSLECDVHSERGLEPASHLPADLLTDPAVIDVAARTMARMVYGFGNAERIAQYTSPELQREHVKVAGYAIHAAVLEAQTRFQMRPVRVSADGVARREKAK